MADNAFELGPNGTVSLADMYKGIYPAPAQPAAPVAQARPNVTAEGLNIRSVQTVPIGPNGMPLPAPSSPKPTQEQMQAIRGSSPLPLEGTGPSGNRLAAGPENTFQVGPSFPFGYSPSKQNAALNAINANTGLQAELLSKGIAGHGRYMSSLADMFGAPDPGHTPDLSGNDPWGDKLRGPAGRSTVQAPGYAYGAPAAAAKPAVSAPKSLLSTLADMFTPATPTGPGSGAPGWSNPNITYSPSNMTSTAVDGSSQAFNPPSMQTSSRWNTGY